MSEVENLKEKLAAAHAFFAERGLADWASLVERASEQIKQGDFSSLDKLWVKFAPTCDVDDLIITQPWLHRPPLTEEAANEFNCDLAKVANDLFAALEKVKAIMP